MNINIMKAMLVLNQLHAWTCAKPSHLKHLEEDTILSFYIITIIMHVVTQDKSLSTPNHLSTAWSTITLIVIINMFTHNMLNHGYCVKHIYKNKNKLSSYPLFLATVASSNYRHYCLSLAWLNNSMRVIIVQECRGLSWNLQTFYSKEKTT